MGYAAQLRAPRLAALHRAHNDDLCLGFCHRPCESVLSCCNASAVKCLWEITPARTSAVEVEDGASVLIAIEAWPAFVPACVAPLRAEKGSDASAVLLLQCPTKVASTLAMVCYNNSKAASTAERFKPLLPRLSFVARDALRVQMTGADWANQDEIGELLAAAQADESRRSSSTPLPAERKQLVVVAVELSGGQVQAYGCLLRGMDGPDAERGPWQYCLDSGRQWSHSQPTGFTCGDSIILLFKD
ncbi:hypothetical protein T492DRAFT_891902 [Pavlovales sp. CCMP2436]|nr:hypothetical protein T492DRAFT_891902 [Pavlovales sp. CCMP2436]